MSIRKGLFTHLGSNCNAGSGVAAEGISMDEKVRKKSVTD